MIPIELEQVPNQNFQVTLEDDFYDLTLLTDGDITLLTVVRNNELIITNAKAVPNKDIILSEYKFSEHGNFRFTSVDDDNYPFFSNYGISSFFQYVTKAEVISGT